MKSLHRKALVAAIALLGMPTLYPMVSFKHSQTESGQQVLTIGEVHTLLDNPNIPKKLVQEPLSALVRALESTRSGATPLPLIVEGSAYNVSHSVAALSPVLGALKGLYKRLLPREDNSLEFHAIEERGIESDMLNECILYVSKLITQTTSDEDICTFYNLTGHQPAPREVSHDSFTDLMRRTISTPRIPVSVGRFLASLERHKKRMIEIAEKHKDDAKYAPFFEQGLITYTEASTKIDALMRAQGTEIPLWRALYTLFFDCETAKQKLEKITEVERLFQDNTDVLFQDFCVLDRLIDLLKKGYPAVALFVGNRHAKNLNRKWADCGWKTLSEGTVITIDTALATNYSLSVEFYTNLLASVRNLIDYQSSQPKPAEARQSQCHQCFAFGHMQACAQCKKATYCGQECQKLAWKEHKLVCKAPAKKE